jgi:signal transduction histidine kinase
MFDRRLDQVRDARLELRHWWSRERITGIALFLFAVRWVAWAVAALIVLLDIVPKANVQREPWLLMVTFVQSAAVTLYLPLFRSRMREALQRRLNRDVDDILIVGLLDVALSLGIVYLSGGWDSPYYLFAVASLLVPSSSLELRANMPLAVGFVGAYALTVATGGEGWDGPWHGEELNNFVVFLTIPFIVAVVVQFFGWMGRQLAEQREAARAALAENVLLQQEREELAAAQERSRIAREIHDGVSQSIYVLSLNLEAAADAAANEQATSERLHRLVTLAKQTLLEVRHYIFDLKPLLDGESGVASALRNQGREFTAVAGLPVSVEIVGEERALSTAQSAALYRISQEALANVYRHASASQVVMRLEFQESAVALEVRDDGCGIEAAAGAGRGLRNMHQRAEDLWGTLVVDGNGGGTRVRAELPLEGP